MSRDGSIALIGVHPVVHARDLVEPVAEALPNRGTAKEGIRLGIDLAAARCQQGSDRTVGRQNVLVEIDVLCPDFIQEINRCCLFFGAGGMVFGLVAPSPPTVAKR